jgi:hypothetical protein
MASMYSTIDKTKIVATILPQAVTETTTGSAVDTNAFNSVGLIVTVGTITTADASNKFVLSFEHGDKSDMSDAASAANYVTAVQGTLTDMTVKATTGDEVTYTWHYFGDKRYLRAKLTVTGTVSGLFAAYAQLAIPGKAPVS